MPSDILSTVIASWSPLLPDDTSAAADDDATDDDASRRVDSFLADFLDRTSPMVYGFHIDLQTSKLTKIRDANVHV